MNRSQGISSAAALVLTCISTSAAFAQTAKLIPFNQFYQSLSQSSFAAQAGNPQSVVESSAAFEAIRKHIISLYNGVAVNHSFLVQSAAFDCVPIMQQPGVRLRGITSLAEPPPLPGGEGTVPDDVDQGQKDALGNVTTCESGTIPMRRITLEDVSRFKNLQEFFQKGPHGAGQPVMPGSSPVDGTHLHSIASTGPGGNIPNDGALSAMLVWKPYVNANEIFSLSQIWAINTHGPTQTVEVGWQTFPKLYNTNYSVPFIYWTPDGYSLNGPSCYNLTCSAFVQTSSRLKLGAPFANYSTIPGTKWPIGVGARLYNGNWWVYLSQTTNPDKPTYTTIGYYPGSLYKGTAMANGANRLDFGGEVDGINQWAPMGSGRVPVYFSDRNSGSISNIQAFIGSNLVARKLTSYNEALRCYLGIVGNQVQSSGVTSSSLAFGGSGGAGC